jgi:hypothetical protein
MCISTYIQLAYFYGYFNLLSFESSYFFCGEFSLFYEKYFQKYILCLMFLFEKQSKEPIFFNSSKIITITYNMKGCLTFYTFIFGTSPNLEKYTCGLSPLEQHHKSEGKKLFEGEKIGHPIPNKLYISKRVQNGRIWEGSSNFCNW